MSQAYVARVAAAFVKELVTTYYKRYSADMLRYWDQTITLHYAVEK
jgi:hypothetical protein